ncbi:MAG: ribonuclease H-like domain-containing protein [Saprospiraceae bacterium]|nr:ribonuclease H-like domain-containing protein [Saprospiraceae bacterium]
MNTPVVLFIDIETVSETSSYAELSEAKQLFWQKKSNAWIRQSDEVNEELFDRLYKSKAAIFAEFGKIVCISIGYNAYDPATKDFTFRIKSFYGEDEKTLLTDFLNLVTQHFNNPNKHTFCGHNIKEFDIPYICRRALVHGLHLPDTLQLSGKKPWEVNHLVDTLEYWKFGDFKHYISLALLADLFGIPTPKDDIDGSLVGKVYWEEKNLGRIKTYCQKDVYTVAKIYSHLSSGKFVAAEMIVEAE